MIKPFPLAVTARAALALLSLGATTIAGIATTQPINPRELPSLAPMIERAAPAVVNIAVSTSVRQDRDAPQDEFLRRFFDFEAPPGGRREVEGAGSGVIVDPIKGYVLTNHHVIENADEITVTLQENRSLSARVVGSDARADLAVLQIDPDNLKGITFGDSNTLRVGDYVLAIGNPFGFSNTVTSGIVSALSRSGINSGNGSFEDFIQTDAPINPGNSGGALVNLNGELVGINSAIISRTGGNVGIGFAIPVNMARTIMAQLIETGTVRRGLLGVQIRDITPGLATTLGLPDNSGALVTSVGPKSAAEQARIEVGDVIVSINGLRLRASGSLRNAIGLLPPGERVAVGVLRDGREQTLTAVLGELEQPATVASPARPQKEPALDAAFEGAELVDRGAPNGGAGLLVARVDQGSPAAARGLRPGDVITRVNRTDVRTQAEAIALMQDAPAVMLTILRDGRSELIIIR